MKKRKCHSRQNWEWRTLESKTELGVCTIRVIWCVLSGRDTPTASGPNSFGKTSQGFTNERRVWDMKFIDEARAPSTWCVTVVYISLCTSVIIYYCNVEYLFCIPVYTHVYVHMQTPIGLCFLSLVTKQYIIYIINYYNYYDSYKKAISIKWPELSTYSICML